MRSAITAIPVAAARRFDIPFYVLFRRYPSRVRLRDSPKSRSLVGEEAVSLRDAAEITIKFFKFRKIRRERRLLAARAELFGKISYCVRQINLRNYSFYVAQRQRKMVQKRKGKERKEERKRERVERKKKKSIHFALPTAVAFDLRVIKNGENFRKLS